MPLKLIHSISGVSKSEVEADESFLQSFTASDDNINQVMALYQRINVVYPAVFVCFMVVSSAAKSCWIQAFGDKKCSSVQRVEQATVQSENTEVDLSQIANIFSTGVVIVAKSSLIDELAIAAPGDVSDVAARKNPSLTDIAALKNLQAKRQKLLELEKQAGNGYCEARLHRHLTLEDIKNIYSLGEFAQYTTLG